MNKTTFIRSTGAMSWIDPKTGLPEVDKGGNPGETTTRSVFLGKKAYRFCNFLEVKVDVENGAIVSADYTNISGMYRSLSFAGISSEPVGNVGRTQNQLASDFVIFKQVVGCRTVSAEKIGTGSGGGIGVLAGIGLGICIIGTGGWGLVALGIAGGATGALTGKEVAELVTGFPPIWTEIELTIYADGSTKQKLIAHSLFPSVSFYRHDLGTSKNSYKQISNYNAIPALKRWNEHGWSDAPSTRKGATSGNPWNMESGNKKLGGHTVHRSCPTGYECG